MNVDKSRLTEKLREWKRIISESNLPLWDELPKLELYMDQVVMLLNEYLSYIYELNYDEKNVTASMINNYVKMKIIPPPVKKKYSRIHLSRLIIICSLKKCLNISTVHRILPKTDDAQENKKIYNAFVKSRSLAVENEIAVIQGEFDTVISGSDLSVAIGDMITRMAVATDLHKIFTEKFTEVVFDNPISDETEKKQEKQDKQQKEKEKQDKK